VLSLDQANTLCTSVFESVRTQLSSKSLTLLEERRSTLQSAVSQTTKDQLINTNRLLNLCFCVVMFTRPQSTRPRSARPRPWLEISALDSEAKTDA